MHLKLRILARNDHAEIHFTGFQQVVGIDRCRTVVRADRFALDMRIADQTVTGRDLRCPFFDLEDRSGRQIRDANGIA